MCRISEGRKQSTADRLARVDCAGEALRSNVFLCGKMFSCYCRPPFFFVLLFRVLSGALRSEDTLGYDAQRLVEGYKIKFGHLGILYVRVRASVRARAYRKKYPGPSPLLIG